MPTIIIYKQLRERWNVTLGRQVNEETRWRWDHEEYSHLTRSVGLPARAGERAPVYTMHHLARCEAVKVKLPMDARFEAFRGYGGVVHWTRSPLVRDGKPRVELTIDEVARIATEGLRAANGDTFTFVGGDDERRRGADAGVVARDAVVVGPVPGDSVPGTLVAGGGGAGLRSEPTGGDGVDAARRGSTPTDGARPALVVVPDDGVVDDGVVRVNFPDLGVCVIAPAGAEVVGGREAPSLVLLGPRRPGEGGPKRMTVARAILPEMARLGWYGLKWEPFAAEPAPRPLFVDPYTAERLGPKPKSRKAPKPEPAVAMLF